MGSERGLHSQPHERGDSEVVRFASTTWPKAGVLGRGATAAVWRRGLRFLACCQRFACGQLACCRFSSGIGGGGRGPRREQLSRAAWQCRRGCAGPGARREQSSEWCCCNRCMLSTTRDRGSEPTIGGPSACWLIKKK